MCTQSCEGRSSGITTERPRGRGRLNSSSVSVRRRCWRSRAIGVATEGCGFEGPSAEMLAMYSEVL